MKTLTYEQMINRVKDLERNADKYRPHVVIYNDKFLSNESAKVTARKLKVKK